MPASATPPRWVVDFCEDYTPLLFDVGKWTLIVAILLGVALAVSNIVIALRPKLETDKFGVRTATTSAGAILDALKGFLQALSTAPTWLALFGGAILLLWLAGNAVPEICRPPAPPPPPACVKLCPVGRAGDATATRPDAGAQISATTSSGR